MVNTDDMNDIVSLGMVRDAQAKHIEELEAKLAKADQELEFADHLFRSVDGWLKFGNTTIHSIRCAVNAYAKKRTTLAELTGGKDE